jgi:ribosomal protein S18 acetylase RimI-like enzyme
MRDQASGFCIYDDPALAIALARRAALRVLYLDFDVHHGDGVEALFADDPGVLTVSFHESGRYLFPGTGAASSIGEGAAAGTQVNVPFEPYAGEAAWLPAVRTLVPALAAAFDPDVVVSQHGADSHAWDPLAHLRMTTTAMGAAARITDAVAHRWAAGRWLSTGGGGYDAYRVVPRSWSLVWLAGAHREPPDETPSAWRDRWSDEAARYGQAPLPWSFTDPPNAGEPIDAQQQLADRASAEVVAAVRSATVPALLRAALDRGWWTPEAPSPADRAAEAAPSGRPTIVELEADTHGRLRLAPRVVAPADAAAGHALVAGALVSGEARAVAGLVDDVIVGLGLVGGGRLLALGVAPEHRRAGLGTALLKRLAPSEATVTVAERDPIDPLPQAARMAIARRLLEGAGLDVRAARGMVATVDRAAITATRPAARP